MNTELTQSGGTIIEVNDIPLAELAERIKILLERIRTNSGNDIWEVGELLRLARLDMPSNELFGNWCSLNFSGHSRPTLYNYCQLADQFGDRKELADIIPQSGLYLLAQDKCDEFREEIIEEFQSEEKVSYKQVQDAIKSHKPTVEKVETTKSYKLTHPQIFLIWKALNMMELGASEDDKILITEIKGILGEPL